MADDFPHRDLPTEYGHAGQDAGTPVDALDHLEPGDRVLWGDRTQPCTVARVVEPGDRVGQVLDASVISPRIHAHQKERAEVEGKDFPEDFFLEPCDVFCDPTRWGRLVGKTFAVIHGPRGGFYAIAEPEDGRTYAALFRAVRSFHSTGSSRKGAWTYETDFEGPLTVVEAGEPPEELDPVGDLPAYDDIKDNRLVAFDNDRRGNDGTGEHYVVAETVAEAFDVGLGEAHRRARERHRAEHDGDDAEADDGPLPHGARPGRVAGTPDGVCHATVTVTGLVDTEYGLKAVIETPPPWECPDDARAANDVIKSFPWGECHYEFDSDREAWLVDADELTKVAGEFRDFGYAVRAEYDAEDAVEPPAA